MVNNVLESYFCCFAIFMLISTQMIFLRLFLCALNFFLFRYNEPCASTIATAYSSNNNNNDPKVATTDIRGKCTDQHTGTSAAAPMIVGVIALALEANKNLSWREIQHLLIRTATPGNLLAHDWRVNDVGRSYSHNFGYILVEKTQKS